MENAIGLVCLIAAIGLTAHILALYARTRRERQASAPRLPDPLETARDAIIAFHGRPDVNLDVFAESIAKAISDSCKIAVQRDRVLTGYKAAEDRRLAKLVEAEHRRRIELEHHKAALCEAERRERDRAMTRAEQKPARLKLVKGLREGALLHLNDDCQCRTIHACSQRQREALQQAEEIEKNL